MYKWASLSLLTAFVLVFRTGTVNTAPGSAYAEFGNTKVIASVFGPRESKKAMIYSNTGRLNCNVSYTTFATRDREQGTMDTGSIGQWKICGIIAGDLPVVISCACFALTDAGITMYDLVSSVSVSCIHRNLVIDPNLEEENCQDGNLMISCMPSRCEVTQLTVTGDWPTPTLDEGMQLCLDACAELANIMRSCLRDAASASQE